MPSITLYFSIMSDLRFYPLKIKDIRKETADCRSFSLEIPESLRSRFAFIPGQYLTFRTQIQGEEVRRSYSLCSSPSEGEWRVAVKKVDQGKFSQYIMDQARVGDTLEVMPPMGHFISKGPRPEGKSYLAVAAGSGITPVLSILKHVLETEEKSRFTLVFGNRYGHSILFREVLANLKNKYMDRFRVYHILSREQLEFPLFMGRITPQKMEELGDQLIAINQMEEIFLCGPEEMILSLREWLLDRSYPSAQIHMELFTSPDQPKPAHQEWMADRKRQSGEISQVAVIIDGRRTEIELAYDGVSILDAALAKGADLPYACKGGVCCTCRAKIVEGEVEMEVNYALEPDELEKGFVLTCQSHPLTDRVVVDFDAR